MEKKKVDIVTFKVDRTLRKALEGVSNRSQFIRSAILSALGEVCPLCRGAGALTPGQQKHWSDFEADHSLEECQECHELHLTCANKRKKRKGQERR